MLVPRKMSVSPLESWLTARYLLPGRDAGALGTVAPAQLYECPPCQGSDQGGEGVPQAARVQCKNVLKIRRRKMNHHKYRKLVKRTRFLRRRVREGRLKRKQVCVGPSAGPGRGMGRGMGPGPAHQRSRPLPAQSKFERDLRRIWLKAGLREAPAGWQTPKIYQKAK